ncbi:MULTISPECIES: cupin domain-containing protein [Mycolicibacterium]|uniref:cupin domain-containing protein n=1 Tax=Mycolicibacterium TaxID=1866885 RepID=UPI000E06D31A|nr:cupin domain-containing protein [Mycolicibacterium aichiense]MCV7021323.1 cupin domain-containing protein [Mycolicibacterium aichiense]STZ24754.1 cupin 2 domain-containing protein [Mycolicibacterium aichiense]
MKPVRCFPAALTIAITGAVLFPASAAATPNSGIEADTLVQSTLDGRDFVTRELTIAPGGTTGWHYHPGQVFGVIKQGTLTHYKGDCSVDGVYNAGDSISEGSGTGYIHEGRNEGPVPVVMWVLYIKPAGSPLAVDAPNPGCPFE